MGDYVLANETWFDKNALSRWTPELLTQVQQHGYALQNGYFYTAIAAADFANHAIGWHLLAEPVSAGFSQSYETSAEEITNNRWSVLGAMLVMLLMMQFLINWQIIRPLRVTEEIMTRSEKMSNLSLRVPIIANDEVGAMATAYNSQMDRFAQIMTEVQRVLKALSAGQLDARIRLPMENDFASFRDGVNDTAEAVSNVFIQLEQVFDALAKGNMRSQLNNEGLQGRYAAMIDIMQVTICKKWLRYLTRYHYPWRTYKKARLMNALRSMLTAIYYTCVIMSTTLLLQLVLLLPKQPKSY
jgi:methyl-accepting chemotaxis protein